MMVFLMFHHFLTNGLLYQVNDGKLYYPIVARAIEYLIAALLFKSLFRPEKIFFSGLHLFLFEIAFSAGSAAYVSVIDNSNIFFPQFFPFHTVVDGCIVWAVLGNLNSKRLRMAVIVFGFALSIVFEYLLTYHYYNTGQTVTDNSLKVLPTMRYRFVDSGMIRIPDATKKYCIVFLSFNECLPCRRLTPFVKDLCRRFSSENVAVIKINPVNTAEEIRDTDTGCLRTVMPDDTAAFNAQINNRITGMPLLLVVNSSGRVLYTYQSDLPRERDLIFTAIIKIVTQ